eukprot:gi/632937309/ref/XP_007898064.1/ PREDICTED: glutathione peroxidase 1-like [Callorhinchus milii]
MGVRHRRAGPRDTVCELFLLLTMSLLHCSCTKYDQDRQANTIYNFQVKALNGSQVSLQRHQRQILLVTNVAVYNKLNALMENFTGSPFTVLGFPCNQFGHQDPGKYFSEEDSEVLNVLKYVRPGNGFVPNFPIFGKILVNGESEHPLYTFLKVSVSLMVRDSLGYGMKGILSLWQEMVFCCLKHDFLSSSQASCAFVNPVLGDKNKLHWSPLKVSDIRWNFEKFLVDGNGRPLKR